MKVKIIAFLIHILTQFAIGITYTVSGILFMLGLGGIASTILANFMRSVCDVLGLNYREAANYGVDYIEDMKN